MSPLKNLGSLIIAGSISVPFFSCPVVLAEDIRPSRCHTLGEGDLPKETRDKCKEQKGTTALESAVNTCRKEMEPIKLGVTDFIANATCFIRESAVPVRENIEYLRCAPQEVQFGAIVVSALAASLLGIRRGGLVRKLMYGSLGGLGAAAVIYPDESKAIAKEGCEAGKYYGMVAYNFFRGH